MNPPGRTRRPCRSRCSGTSRSRRRSRRGAARHRSACRHAPPGHHRPAWWQLTRHAGAVSWCPSHHRIGRVPAPRQSTCHHHPPDAVARTRKAARAERTRRAFNAQSPGRASPPRTWHSITAGRVLPALRGHDRARGVQASRVKDGPVGLPADLRRHPRVPQAPTSPPDRDLRVARRRMPMADVLTGRLDRTECPLEPEYPRCTAFWSHATALSRGRRRPSAPDAHGRWPMPISTSAPASVARRARSMHHSSATATPTRHDRDRERCRKCTEPTALIITRCVERVVRREVDGRCCRSGMSCLLCAPTQAI